MTWLWKPTIVALSFYGLGVQGATTYAPPPPEYAQGEVPYTPPSIDRPEAYPGQHGHSEPPDDFICHDKPEPGEHECHCKRMTGESDTLCEAEPDVSGCESWCWATSTLVPDDTGPINIDGQHYRRHASHCRCPVMRHEPGAAGTPGKDVECGMTHHEGRP
jgi:hypothetical protein